MLRVGVFPHFADVMQEAAGQDEVAIELGIGVAEGVPAAHDACDVLDQPAAPCVVEGARGCCAAEACFEFCQQEVTDALKARVRHAGDEVPDCLPVCFLFVAQLGASGVEGCFFFRGERAHAEFGSFHAVAAHLPCGRHGDALSHLCMAAVTVPGGVFPDFDGDAGRYVGEAELYVGLAGFGRPLGFL